MANIIKNFPGVRALNDVSFSLEPQSVHAIVGQNGAGKSTLINILNGSLAKDRGRILIDGKEAQIYSTADAIDWGIACIHQDMYVFADMSIAENIFIGDMPTKGKTGHLDFKKMYHNARRIFEDMGVDIDVRRRVRGLGVAEQQLIMIARALHRKSKILIMDEPTASLDVPEVEKLFTIIKRLVQSGQAVIYISHYLNEVFEIADTITVLRNGKKIITEQVIRLNESRVIELMLGYKEETKQFVPNSEIGEIVLEVKNLNRAKVLNDVSFNIKAGEVIGFAGHLGSGRTELVRAIFGADKRESGSIFIKGKQMAINSPSEAVAAGLGLLTEEKFQGIIPMFSVKNNISLTNLKKLSRTLGLDNKEEKAIAEHFVAMLKIKVSSVLQKVRNLSGGNQQKVIFAKWLHSDTKVLFLDEPTKGIDVGAKIEILDMILNLAKKGIAIVLISSEFSDLAHVCNRVLILKKGKIIKEFSDIPSDSFLQAEVNAAV
ncbi:MAG: sugar ABC transporter ATP-binding protein [Desulfobacterales bacterium]